MSKMVLTEEIVDAYANAKLMRCFKQLCDQLDSNGEIRKKTLSIMRKGKNDTAITKGIFKRYCNIDLDDEEAYELSKCLKAYYKKSSERKPFSEDFKNQLFAKQNGECSICGKQLDYQKMHIDHIVPFKYVGDELDNNYQALCENCNHHKGAKVDYYFRVLIGLE